MKHRAWFASATLIFGLASCKSSNSPEATGNAGTPSGGAVGSQRGGEHSASEAGAPAGGDDDTALAGQGGSSAMAGAGTAGVAGKISATPPDGDFILGPAVDDQRAVVLPLEHLVEINHPMTLLQDSEGNLIVSGENDSQAFYRGVVQKFDPNLELVWSANLAELTSRPNLNGAGYAASLAADGGIFFGGDLVLASVVGKLNADGTLAWVKQLDDPDSAEVVATLALADGAVLALLHGRRLVRFEADGALGWSQLYTATGDFPSRIFLDADGELSLVGATSVIHTDIDGNELWRASTARSPLASYPFVAQAAAGDGYYSWAVLEPSTSPLATSLHGLAKYANDWSLEWYRGVEPVRVAGTWSGNFSDFRPPMEKRALASDEAVYLTGMYSNQGTSQLTGDRAPLFLGRYDLHGDRVWFQEFALDSPYGNHLSWNCRSLVLDADNNPILLLGGNLDANKQAGLLVKFDATDGSPI